MTILKNKIGIFTALKNPWVASLAVFLLMAGCSATKLTSSWTMEEIEPKVYEQVGVVLMSPKDSNRALIEVAVAEQLRAKGIKGIATFDIFPFAAKMDKVSDPDMTAEERSAKIKQRVVEEEIDGLIIIVIYDRKQEERYVQSNNYPMYGPAVYSPVYNYAFYDYYSYAYNTVYYQPGYYTQSSSYFIESNFYDVETTKLIWSGHTKTKDPQNLDYEAGNFASIIVAEMLNKKVLAKGN